MLCKWCPSFRVLCHIYVGFPSLISNFLIKGHSNGPSKCKTLCNCNLLAFILRSCQYLTQQTSWRTTSCVLPVVFQLHPYLQTDSAICQPRIRHTVLIGRETEARHSVTSHSHWHFSNLCYEISSLSAFSSLTCWLPEDRAIRKQHAACAFNPYPANVENMVSS
jgi:hypothetical protein